MSLIPGKFDGLANNVEGAIEVRRSMHRGDKIRFKLRRREINALLQALMKKNSEAFGIGFFGGGVIGHGIFRKKDCEHRTQTIQLNVSAGDYFS